MDLHLVAGASKNQVLAIKDMATTKHCKDHKKLGHGQHIQRIDVRWTKGVHLLTFRATPEWEEILKAALSERKLLAE